MAVDLNQYYLRAGTMVSFSNSGALCPKSVVPVPSVVVGLALNPSVAVSPANTFDIFVDDAFSSTGFTLPDGHAADTGIVLPVEVQGIEVVPGQNLRLQSNGEQEAAGGVDCSWALRRTTAQDLNKYYIHGGNIVDIAAGDTSPISAVPIDGQIIGVAMNVGVAIDAETTFDILVSGADTGVDVILPAGVVIRKGLPLQFTAAGPAVNVGDGIRLRSNGEQAAAGDADFTWIVRP